MDWQNVGAQAITALVPVGSLLLTYLVRKVVPKMPRFAVPLVAMLLGLALSALQQYMGGAAQPLVVMAALGAAAKWLNEMYTTVKEHGTS